jgi:hypothetical protein
MMQRICPSIAQVARAQRAVLAAVERGRVEGVDEEGRETGETAGGRDNGRKVLKDLNGLLLRLPRAALHVNHICMCTHI